MGTNLIIIDGYFPAGKIGIMLDIYDSAYPDDTLYPKLIEMGGWEIGLQGENNDLLQYPAGFTLSFMCDLSIDRFFALATELQTKEKILVDVRKNLIQIFSGYVYNTEKSMTIDYRHQIISVKIVDRFVEFKNYDPRTNPFGYTTGDFVLINDLILDLFSKTNALNNITTIVNLCPYEAQIHGDTIYYGVQYWGICYARYFGADSIYQDLLQVLQALLNSIGCKGYIGFDNKFYIVPRNYSKDLIPKTLPEGSFSDKIEVDIIRRMKGIQMLLYTGTIGEYNEADLGLVEKDGTGALKYPDLVEFIRMDQPVGTIPDGRTVSNLFLKLEGEWYYTEPNHVRRKLADGTYSADTALWQLTGNDAWALIQNDRPLLKFNFYPSKTDGYSNLLTDLLIGDFFNRVSIPNKIMHARWLNYTWKDDYVEVEAHVEDTPAIVYSLFAGTDDGIWASGDNGATFVMIALRGSGIEAFAKKGTEIFAAGPPGIFHSIDNGASWQELATVLGGISSSPTCIIVNGTDLYVGATNGSAGVWRSGDNGVTWTQLAYMSGAPLVSSMVFKGTTLWVGTNDSVFYSTNYGASWTRLDLENFNNFYITCLVIDGENIYAGTSGGVYRSTDNGASWTRLLNDTNNYIWSLAIIGTNIFAGTENGICFSNDAGSTWTQVGLGGLTIWTLLSSGSSIYAGTSAGLYVSRDNGATWILVGMNTCGVYAIMVN